MVKVKLVEHFYSIQGEGLYTGTPVHFVRFAGCNQNPPCVWCDTMNSIEAKGNKFEEVAVDALSYEISFSPASMVVITGGEPTLQERALIGLASDLKNRGMEIHLETNGLIYYSALNTLDFVTLSPKLPSSGGRMPEASHLNKFKGVRKELKFVIADSKDLTTCMELLEGLYDLDPIWKTTPTFLTPVWKNDLKEYQKQGHLLANAALFDDTPIRRFFTTRVLSLYISAQLHKVFNVR